MPTDATITTPAYREHLSRTMSEATLRDKHIIPLAVTLAWKVAWTWRSIHSPAGEPDLRLLHYGQRRILIVELKMVGKVPNHEQHEWLDWWRHCGAEVHIWTPAHWLDGSIETVLKGDA